MKFQALDAIRGVAALLIVVRHAPDFFGGTGPPETYLAVDLFFVLSGFVLAHAYGARIDRGMSAGEFVRARVIRLYPMFALALVVAVGASVFEMVAGKGGPAAPFVVSALYSVLVLPTPPGWTSGNLFPLNGPAWSLFFELVANAIMGLAWRRLTARVLTWIVAGFAIALILAVARAGSADTGWNWATFGVGFVRVGFSFFTGVLLYRLRDSVQLRWSPWFAIAATAIALTLPTPAPWRSAYDLGCILFVFPGIVLSAAAREPGVGAQVCAFLGLISYPLYAIHQPAQRLIDDVVGWTGRDVRTAAPLAGLPLLVMLSLAAWLLATRVDQPLRNWLTAMWVPPRRPSARHAAVASEGPS